MVKRWKCQQSSVGYPILIKGARFDSIGLGPGESHSLLAFVVCFEQLDAPKLHDAFGLGSMGFGLMFPGVCVSVGRNR